MSSIMITGGAGFIGSHLAEELVKKGHKVVVVDNFFLGTKANLKSVKGRIKFYKHDYCDMAFMQRVLAEHEIEYVFHLAGKSSAPMFDEQEAHGMSVNVTGFASLLRACVNTGVKRVIYATTSSIYGGLPLHREDVKVFPPNFYALTKYTMEHTARLFNEICGLESAGFRFFSVYGKNEKHKKNFANLISQFLWNIQDNEEIVVYGDGTQTRDFIYVMDVVAGLIRGMEMDRRYAQASIYNLGTTKSYTLNEMIRILEEETGKKANIKHVENPVKNYIKHIKADLSKIKRDLGFSPKYTLRQGIKDILSG